MGGLQILGIVLLVLAFVFIGIESVVPGFGAPGFLGICCLISGIALTSQTWGGALKLMAVLIVLMALFIVLILRLLSKGVIKSPIILKEKLDKESGFISTKDLDYLVGQTGITATDLRPAGKMNIDDLLVDVVSDGPYILRGKPVKITGVRNSSLLVHEMPEQKS